VGEEAEAIFAALNLTVADQKCAPVVQAFDGYFMPKQNPVLWCCVLCQRFQHESETVAYLRTLQEIADKCGYTAAVKTEEIRVQFVIGMKDKEVSKTLQSDADPTLKKVTIKARQEEVLKTQLSSQVKASNSSSIDAVSRGYKRHDKEEKRQEIEGCGNCGRKHQPCKCPAYNKNCRKFGKLGHFAHVCRSSQCKHLKQYRLKVNQVRQMLIMGAMVTLLLCPWVKSQLILLV